PQNVRLQTAMRLVLCAGLVAASLAGFLIEPSGKLPLLLPVMATAIIARLGGWRLVSACVALLWAGLSLLTLSGFVMVADAIMVGGVSALTALLTFRPERPLIGMYGLYQSTEHEVLRSLLAATPIVLLDQEGRIKRASPASHDIFQRADEQLWGIPFSELVPGFDHQEHARAESEAGLVKPAGNNWQIIRPDQPHIDVELWLDHTPDGPLIRLVDLTPRLTADEQARELHSQLNKVWRLNSLGEMAATLAHELNQPLGAAAAYLHAAQEDMKTAGPLGESALRTTELAKAQMLRGGQIIRRMRELLTMEMRTLAKERLSLVVDDVLPILILTGQDRNIRIETDIAMPDLVRLDRIQLQQALVNLVRNAVEASPNGSRVLITGHPVTDRSFEVAVEDSGPGIAPDQVDRVFQPMISTKSGGMGLGLSVTRTIVESHGGNLRVGASRWGGARFSFTLAIANQDEQE
ncbi:two-component system sensor histidine kinase NtrB, partial [Brevundimonas sp.]|uniref:two-component system sensor histidine kinase NtrB n=2 Tax=Brevundimonas sp. TaxID=1871086 RepID=UPI002FCBAF00